MLFGVAGMDTGMSIAQVMGFTILVIAGASQFTAVAYERPCPGAGGGGHGAGGKPADGDVFRGPGAAFGAARRWHKVLISYFMIDQSFAIAAQAYEKAPGAAAGRKARAFCRGLHAHLHSPGDRDAGRRRARQGDPAGLALDFAVPVTFLAMIAPMLRSVPHLAAAVVSVLAALALSFLPSGTGILIAAVLAMAAGAQTELWLARRAGK